MTRIRESCDKFNAIHFLVSYDFFFVRAVCFPEDFNQRQSTCLFSVVGVPNSLRSVEISQDVDYCRQNEDRHNTLKGQFD